MILSCYFYVTYVYIACYLLLRFLPKLSPGTHINTDSSSTKAPHISGKGNLQEERQDPEAEDLHLQGDGKERLP
jgi:hypothetical protein